MRAECAAAAAPFRLAMPRGAAAGAVGDRPGFGTGASLDFQDFRDYVPGDDLRRLDWRAYARCDRLQVRLYRAEVAPWVDVVADLSASMTVTERKERATRDLVEALVAWSERAGGRPRRLRAGGQPFADADAEAVTGGDAPTLVPRVPLRPRGVRVLVSDLLRERDPAPDIARLGAGASGLVVIQVLDPWELDPEVEGPVELVDAEGGARLELDLDEVAVDGYRARLRRLIEAADRATRAAGGTFVSVAAGEPRALFRGELLRRRVIEPWR